MVAFVSGSGAAALGVCMYPIDVFAYSGASPGLIIPVGGMKLASANEIPANMRQLKHLSGLAMYKGSRARREMKCTPVANCLISKCSNMCHPLFLCLFFEEMYESEVILQAERSDMMKLKGRDDNINKCAAKQKSISTAKSKLCTCSAPQSHRR